MSPVQKVLKWCLGGYPEMVGDQNTSMEGDSSVITDHFQNQGFRLYLTGRQCSMLLLGTSPPSPSPLTLMMM